MYAILPDDRPPINPPDREARPATVGLMDYLLAEINAAYWRDRTPGQQASEDYRRAMAAAEGR